MGSTWWWSLLRQGPNEGRQIGGLHMPSDGQVCCEERLMQACPRPALICHRCGEASLFVCGNLRHRARQSYG